MNATNEKRRSVKTMIAAIGLLLLAGAAAWYAMRPRSAWEVPVSAEPPAPGQIYVSVQLTPGKAYTGEAYVPGRGGIFAIDPAPSAWQKLSDDVANTVRVAPSGKRWAYSKVHGGVWVAGSDGTKKEILPLHGNPVWSPDSKRLAISTEKPGAKDARETWLVEVESGNRSKLPIPETDAVEDWSANGDWFLTSSSRPPANGHSYQIYIMHPDGTDPRRVTDAAGLNFAPRFAPDGNRLLYVRVEHQRQGLWIVDRDGRDRKLIFETDQDLLACWSPDGKRLAVQMKHVAPLGPKQEPPRVLIVDADGNNRRFLDLPAALWMGGIDWR